MSFVHDYHVSLWKDEIINNEKEKTGMKKYFVGLVVGVSLGVLAASVSAESATSVANSSKPQDLRQEL